jgi:hypothetical protein
MKAWEEGEIGPGVAWEQSYMVQVCGAKRLNCSLGVALKCTEDIRKVP